MRIVQLVDGFIGEQRIVGRSPADMPEEAREFLKFSGAIFKGMRPRTEKPPSFTDEQLAALAMPVYVLLGEQDVTMDSQAIKQRIERNVAQSELGIIPGARHYLGDQSEPILDFLQRVNGG